MAQSFGEKSGAAGKGCLIVYPKFFHMSNRNKTERDSRNQDTVNPPRKGEEQQNPQKGALGVSHKKGEPHRKDESDGADRNTTKRGENSI